VGFKNQLTPEDLLKLAIAEAATARKWVSPNPSVGCAIQTVSGAVYVGATEPPGGRHAEIVALDRARAAEGDEGVVGATIATTLEPCSHYGRTGPCAAALVAARAANVHVAVADPDSNVSGQGLLILESNGINVTTGVCADEVEEQLVAYLHHRRTGLPYVVAKMASTMDAKTAAADGTSQWITSPEARSDAHLLRAESDAIIVGAGTVRSDDPSLTVRHVDGRDPRRIVLGRAPATAKVHPCLEYSGDLHPLLQQLGAEGVLQVLLEGGATTLHAFHHARLVNRYVVYLAPSLMGGSDGLGLMAGPGAATIGDLWRGTIRSVQMVGPDLRVDLVPTSRDPAT
jgi:diaminohydroxyphosphoribosylaminopyrimidine deaminase / 5-amino-6-(5-phosphoribosylamino)uracil reductase